MDIGRERSCCKYYSFLCVGSLLEVSAIMPLLFFLAYKSSPFAEPSAKGLLS